MNTRIERDTGSAYYWRTLYFLSPSTGCMVYLEEGDRLVSADGFAAVLNRRGGYVPQYNVASLGSREPVWKTVYRELTDDGWDDVQFDKFDRAWDVANHAANIHANNNPVKSQED